ncbi:MAG: hypothetical protein HOP08_01715 [Cyclobacteriaceae bacterium]|nr:hypothetical protein [Cyclobacteriaceae bacterium]
MKKILLMLFAVLTVSAASAQIEKGTVLVGVNSAFSVTRSIPSTGSGSTDYNLNLKGGYFLAENFVLGLNLGVSGYSTDASSGSSTLVGVFGRYYFNGKIFLGAGVNSSSSGGSSSTSIPLEVGYAAFINKFIAVEPAIRFVKYDNGSTIGLGVGFTFYLNRGE